MENYIIPSRSRWKIQSKKLKDLNSYIVSVKADYFNKFFTINVLDVLVNNKPIVHNWIIELLENPTVEEFTINHHDANGNFLYKKIIKDAKLVGHKCYHNYTCDGDDLQDHEIIFKYEFIETIENFE